MCVVQTRAPDRGLLCGQCISVWRFELVLHICNSFNGNEFLIGSHVLLLTSLSFQGPQMFTLSCTLSYFSQGDLIVHLRFSFLGVLMRGIRFWFVLLSISALTSVRQTWILSRVSRIVCLLLYTYRAFRLAGWARGFRDHESIMYCNLSLETSSSWGITQCCYCLSVWKSGEISVNVQWCDLILFIFFPASSELVINWTINSISNKFRHQSCLGFYFEFSLHCCLHALMCFKTLRCQFILKLLFRPGTSWNELMNEIFISNNKNKKTWNMI